MIFVTVGGDSFQFNRLVKAVDLYCEREKQEAFMQIGSSDYIPRFSQWTRFLSFKQMQTLIRDSSIVVAHAGAGTILACITSGKVPIVVPRFSQFDEAVDDHQVTFAGQMKNQGYIYMADLEHLSTILKRCMDNGTPSYTSRRPELIAYLDELTVSQ